MVMGRGERVARGYIGAVLAAQALVCAALWDDVTPLQLVLQLAAVGLLWLPLGFTFQHPIQVRAITAVPAVGVSVWWAILSAPMGIIGWGAWAAAVAWLTFPADGRSPDTLAERFAYRRTQTGARQ